MKGLKDMDVATKTRERGVPPDDGATHPRVRECVTAQSLFDSEFYHPNSATLNADAPTDSVKGEAQEFIL